MAHCIHFMILRVWFCALLNSNCKFHYFRGGFYKSYFKKLEYDKNRVENRNEEFRTPTNTAKLKKTLHYLIITGLLQ